MHVPADVVEEIGMFLGRDVQADPLLQQTKPLSLQTLPSELRQQIYSNIFTKHSSRHLSRFPYEDYKHTGCRCGEGLSLTNRLFYEETRLLFYNHARFAFNTPLSCSRFLDGIGPHIEHIGALSITFEYCEIHFLRTIFNKFPPESILHTLYLQYTSQHVRPGLGPIYLPSVQKRDANIAYDIRFRPEIHPLSKLKHVRKVTVEGDIESEEIQEAIVKLSLKIEDAARRDGLMARETEVSEFMYFRKPQILFSIGIPDE
ncbi:hypothetical protein DL95DRAFT_45702 [Leptodontidium sp. 2 PMI_412]|nr:hypothetical protein DL95DRAFT_45702 [Leptodontidium sp. 2 PMI_412]